MFSNSIKTLIYPEITEVTQNTFFRFPNVLLCLPSPSKAEGHPVTRGTFPLSEHCLHIKGLHHILKRTLQNITEHYRTLHFYLSLHSIRNL